jgi:hypothetical protein
MREKKRCDEKSKLQEVQETEKLKFHISPFTYA